MKRLARAVHGGDDGGGAGRPLLAWLW
jgi:hypothetical protein